MQRLLSVAVTVLVALNLGACAKEEASDESVAANPTAAPMVAPIDQGLAVINRDRIEAHLRYLADDARKGRMTGSPEYDESAAYVARHFEEIGLEPAGDDGWYQQVPMLANQIDVESATLVYHQDVGDGRQRWKEDFVMSGDAARPSTEVRAEVVFAGFGIHAPELGYSDLRRR